MLLTVGLWLYHRKSAVWMAVALPLLKLVGGMLILRIVLALIGAAALLVLFIRAKAAPIVPE